MTCVACQKAYGAFATAGRVAATFAKSGLIWNEGLKKQRLNVCEACPRFIKASSTCAECGCNMEIKAGLIAAKCDLNKWRAG